jgi:hypothetical protein
MPNQNLDSGIQFPFKELFLDSLVKETPISSDKLILQLNSILSPDKYCNENS